MSATIDHELARENAMDESEEHITKGEDSSSGTGSKPNTSLAKCDECLQELALYQCPRCHIRSCSLVCCKAHKDRTGCNGKRDRTSYVRAVTDEVLQSDYHFLEDVLGTVDSSKRLLRQVGAASSNAMQQRNGARKRAYRADEKSGDLYPSSPVSRPHTLVLIEDTTGRSIASRLVESGGNQTNTTSNGKWRNFQKQAATKGVQVVYMPAGMERHKSNRSYVKQNTLFWTVEWIICGPEGKGAKKSAASPSKLITSGLSENASLWGAISEVIKSDPSRRGVDRPPFRLLMRRRPCPPKLPSFVELCDTATLASALADTTVIEFPTIFVVHVDRLQEFPRAVAVDDAAVTTVAFTSPVSSAEEC